MVTRLMVTAAILGLCACSSGSSGSSPACNDLVDDGPTVTATEVAAAAPIPTGGAIANGAYLLTALTAYSGAGGPTGHLGLVASEVQTISGATMQQDGTINGQESRYTTTISASGTTLSTSDTCPSPSTATHGYTATATELRIYDVKSGYTLEQVYTLRMATDADGATATDADGAMATDAAARPDH